MSDTQARVIKLKIEEFPSDWGHGKITANFEATKYANESLLDTRVELEIAAFSLTWNDREKFVKELKELIAKYQI